MSPRSAHSIDTCLAYSFRWAGHFSLLFCVNTCFVCCALWTKTWNIENGDESSCLKPNSSSPDPKAHQAVLGHWLAFCSQSRLTYEKMPCHPWLLLCRWEIISHFHLLTFMLLSRLLHVWSKWGKGCLHPLTNTMNQTSKVKHLRWTEEGWRDGAQKSTGCPSRESVFSSGYPCEGGCPLQTLWAPGTFLEHRHTGKTPIHVSLFIYNQLLIKLKYF